MWHVQGSVEVGGAVFVDKPEVKGTHENLRLDSGVLHKNGSERNRLGGRRRDSSRTTGSVFVN
jgi:hypothetical protein